MVVRPGSRVPALCAGVAWLWSAGCAGGSESHIGRAALLAAIEEGDPPVIVDVRSRGEFESGHVPGALHLPFYAAFSGDETIGPVPPGAAVVVYCEHGPRAGFAKWGLGWAGYPRVLYLEGHMTAWKADGLPLERDGAGAPAAPAAAGDPTP